MKRKIQQILVGAIGCAILAISSSAFTIQIYADNAIELAEVKLSDINNHWGKEPIQFLVNKGAISGYPDGTFQPNKTISKAEFVSIALKSARNGVVTQSPGGHWATGIFNDAESLHVLLPGEMPLTEWDKPISRYEMTLVMVRITENILNESKASTSEVAKIMADYLAVQKQKAYSYYVEQAFMKGIVSGRDAQGTFDGAANGSRAEASVMVARILDKSRRVSIDVNKVVQGSGTIINQTDANRPNPKAGDTFVKKDGTKVVLEVGPAGVLGQNQQVDLFGGMKYPDGSVVKDGSLGTKAMGYLGQTYLVDSKTGEGHFWQDWSKIKEYEYQQANKIQNPKDGQRYGNWTVYSEAVGMWTWTGPVNG